jgi:hypothetical protein
VDYQPHESDEAGKRRPIAKEDFKLLNLVLANLIAERYEGKTNRRTDKTLIDGQNLPGDRYSSKHIVMGDMAKVVKEFEAIERKPDYLMEIPFTNWSNALRAAYPGCGSSIMFVGCKHKDATNVTVEMSEGPPGIHGHPRLMYQLKSDGKKWLVVERWLQNML